MLSFNSRHSEVPAKRLTVASPLAWLAWAAIAPVSALSAPEVPDVVSPFVKRHCIDCHDATTQEGGFRLDTLEADFGSAHTAERWAEVMGRIGSGEMPPEDRPRPTAEEISGVVDWLAERIKQGERQRMAARPPVAFYRLSREEYSNAVSDLLGAHYDAAAPGEMTPDPEWHGFRRLGSELSLSPSHVEKYLHAAKAVVDRAFPSEFAPLKTYRKDALDIDWPNQAKRNLLKEKGLLAEVRTLMWPGHRLGNVGPTNRSHDLPPGIYRARMKLSGLPSRDGRPPHVVLYSKQLDRVLFEQDVIAAEDAPATFQFETFLGGKVDVEINNDVSGPSNNPSSGRPTHTHVFTRLADPRSRAPTQRKMTDEQGIPLFPVLIFDAIEWEGPVEQPDAAARRKGFEITADADENTVAESLRIFAGRAWRRSVEAREIDRYMAIFETERAAGESVRSAWKTALMGILSSQSFTYIAEGSPGTVRQKVAPVELASRLSFFLWNSLPDDRLLRSAESGELARPEALESEVARMLGDPKIDRFTESFARQWLQLDKVGMFPPDKKLYPDYDAWLETSMVGESIGFFREVFRNNLPIREFLTGDWTMLNPRLARFYGLPIPATPGFERVTLRPEDHRGGILTQAAVLSLSSDGTRHRPVHRGIWVSETILGKTPNPPPANVNPIEPNPVNEPRATIRMKLAAHTIHAQCASCHRSLDPLGLAFDNYDAIGRWRTTEFVPTGTGVHPPVDASGEMPDGRAFDGPEEFKVLLAADIDRFAAALVEKLATYALRRAMTVDDRDQIAAIARDCKADGYRLRSMVEAVAMSELFQRR